MPRRSQVRGSPDDINRLTPPAPDAAAPAAGLITLVRPDGTTIDATPDQASRLALLGYREQSQAELDTSLGAQGTEEFYSTPGQRISAGLEGVGAGATFGASDYLLGDDDLKARAAYNPGTRMAGETLGALLPLVLTGGASAPVVEGEAAESALARAAGRAPTSLLSDAAEALTVGKPGSLTAAVTRGAIEGSVYGGTSAADHAYLDGSPITAEAILHGIGWGAIMGGALGGVGHGIGAYGNKQGAAIEAEAKAAAGLKTAAEEAEAKRVADLNAESSSRAGAKTSAEEARYAKEMAAHKAEVERIQAQYDADLKASQDAEVPHGALKASSGEAYDLLHSEMTGLSAGLKTANAAADATVDGTVAKLYAAGETADLAPWGHNEANFGRDLNAVKTLYSQVMEAAGAGKYRAASAAADAYGAHVSELAGKLGMPEGAMPNPAPQVKQLIRMRAAAAEIERMPRNVEAFAALSPAKAERMVALMELASKLEVDGAANIAPAVDLLRESLGLASQVGHRGIWKTAKGVLAAEGKPVAQPPVPRMPKEPRAPKSFEGKKYVARPVPDRFTKPEPEVTEPGLARRAIGYAAGGKAYVAARVAGMGRAGAYAAYKWTRDTITYGAKDLTAVRAGVTGRLRAAAAEYLPRAGNVLARSGAVLSPLAISLADGREEHDTKDARKLAARRIAEARSLGANIGDVLYRQLEPLAATQPDLVPAVHAAGVSAFSALLAMMPKDPGAISGLKSIWQPSDEQAAVLERQLAVFTDPVGEAESMVRSGVFDPIKVATLREIAPNSWQDLRIGILERVTSPEVADKLSYHDQIGLSAMLNIPLHSSMAPHYIAAAQEMFAQRSAPLTANPRMSQSGGVPSPGADKTQSQISTER